MKNALILHGTFGNSKENWFLWLEKELKLKGYKVWTPDLPGAESPSIPRYNKFIFEKWKFNNDSIIIGHSSGAVAALGLLQEIPKGILIEKAILVAGFTNDLDWDPTRELFKYNFNWKKIKNGARKFVLFHSDNDSYVTIDHGLRFQKYLDAELILLKGQGHFSTSSNPKYTEFPELLPHIFS